MKLFVNNEERELDSPNIPAILSLLGLSAKGVAVAVNNTVVPKAAWEGFSLSENDRITIIRATQGG